MFTKPYREPSFRISLQRLMDFAASLTVPVEIVGGAYGTTVGNSAIRGTRRRMLADSNKQLE